MPLSLLALPNPTPYDPAEDPPGSIAPLGSRARGCQNCLPPLGEVDFVEVRSGAEKPRPVAVGDSDPGLHAFVISPDSTVRGRSQTSFLASFPISFEF